MSSGILALEGACGVRFVLGAASLDAQNFRS